jgi:tetratricopeptide (TPR) repeat protein
MGSDSESTSRNLAARPGQSIALRQNSLVARGLQDIARLGTLHFDALFALAGNFSRQGDYQRAIAVFTQAIALEAQSPRAHYERGWAFHSKGDLDAAIADFTEAIRLEDERHPGFLIVGVDYGMCWPVDEVSEESEMEFRARCADDPTEWDFRRRCAARVVNDPQCDNRFPVAARRPSWAINSASCSRPAIGVPCPASNSPNASDASARSAASFSSSSRVATGVFLRTVNTQV